MDIVKVLMVIVLTFAVAQLSLAAGPVAHMGRTGNFDDFNNKSGDSPFYGEPQPPAFEGSDIQDRIFALRYRILELVDAGMLTTENPNPIPASFQSSAVRINTREAELEGASGDPHRVYPDSASALPATKPDTWVMLAVGIGLIGYQVRRKQRRLVRVLLPLGA